MLTDIDAKICKNCRWWRASHTDGTKELVGDGNEGECYRFPPIPRFDGADERDQTGKTDDDYEHAMYWMRPVTEAEEFCGEFISP